MYGESSRHDNPETVLQDRGSKSYNLPLQYLEDITNNFSDEQELGRGGFGVVYKGVQQDGETIAVKKLVLMPGVQEKQFENELDRLIRLEHPNIVRFVGYCYEIKNTYVEHNGKNCFAEMPQRLLCLEYLPNGSLDNHLKDESCGLDWHKRYNIIKGICRGLHYLHEEWQINTPIIHLDLKPANILLDDNMEPKIADFGLSRLFGKEQTRTCTTTRGGTLGYMAPEYLRRGVITTKSDIFSLGVIIIEIITGHRNYPFDTETSCQDFVEPVLENWRNRLQAASTCTSVETYYQQIKGCLEMSLSCVENDETKRPATREIIERLNRWESTTCYVSSEERSPTVWSRSNPMELLVINPRELRFRLELNKRIHCLVQLTNRTENHVLFCFGLTRATSFYCIEPTCGYVEPRSTFNVVVTMDELHELPSVLQCNDEILVQSIISSNGAHLVGGWYLNSYFNHMPSHEVHKVKLTVVYVPPAEPLSLLHAGSEETNTSDSQQLEGFMYQENVDILIRCTCQDLGFFNDRPIAACIIYRCLLHWKLFEAETTNAFARIVTSIFSTIKVKDNNDKLAYWLSNSSTLLLIIQRAFKPIATLTAGTRFTPRRRKSSATIFARIFPRIQAFRGSHLVGGKGDIQQVEAKHPALLFKRKLTSFLEKAYELIRDNLMEEVSPSFRCCIQAPRTRQAQIDHWQRIVKILTDYLRALKSNCVPSFLISKVFSQVFSFMNAELFNHLLLSERCSFSNGEYIKDGLAKLEQWCIYETEKYAGSSWEELRHIRQAVRFLTIHEKQKTTFEEITNVLCPVLSIPQLYRISTIYRDEKYGNHTVSPQFLSSMESILMKEDSDYVVNYRLLLVVDSKSIPFSVDDILESMTGFDVRDVDMPPLIREYPCFNFLHKRTG